jgi:protein-disulfide isomerase
MKSAYLAVSAALLAATAACNGDRGGQQGEASSGPIEKVAPPEGGQWSDVVTQTPEGGFLMGNPQARVKVVEFVSLTCPICAKFDESGGRALIDNYVQTGQVSLEMRNFVRDSADLAASLVARCGGSERFFPLTSALLADQQQWLGRAQEVFTPQRQQEIAALPPGQQALEVARALGFQQWAAQRGVPSARTTQCLTDEAEISRLVQMNADAVSRYNVPGTPTFLINDRLVDNASTWETLEPKIREALGS